MATANELLNTALGEDSVITVDFVTRKINIPETITFLGVESDDDILPLHFKMPKTYQGVDLSTFDANINYLNAKGEGDVYDITDAKVEGEYILFTWKVGRFAAQYAGNVQFNICLKEMDKADPTIITRELNTTIAKLQVLPGLETDDRILEQYGDVLLRWEQSIFGVGSSVSQSVRDVSLEEQNAIKTLSIQEQNVIKELSQKEQTDISTLAEEKQTNLVNQVDAKVEESVRTWLDTNPSTILTQEEIDTLTARLV